MRIRITTETLRRAAAEFRETADAYGRLGDALHRSIAPVRDYGGQLPNQKTALLAQHDALVLRDGFQTEAARLLCVADRYEQADAAAVSIWDAIRAWFAEQFTRLQSLFTPRATPATLPTPPTPPTRPDSEALYGPFHQYQGDSNTCGDTSLSMICNIYHSRRGEPTDVCAVDGITDFIDHFPGGRFPPDPDNPKKGQGGATPIGIEAALIHLGIPATPNPVGTIGELEQALAEGRMVMVSEGKLFGKFAPWGHVMVLVGEEGGDFLFLDPAAPDGQQPQLTRIAKEDFLKNWWYPPLSPCWVIG